MIKRVTIELDEEGIDEFLSCLMDLSEEEVGATLTVPAKWINPGPWWKFWDRRGKVVRGDFQVVRVA